MTCGVRDENLLIAYEYWPRSALCGPLRRWVPSFPACVKHHLALRVPGTVYQETCACQIGPTSTTLASEVSALPVRRPRASSLEFACARRHPPWKWSAATRENPAPVLIAPVLQLPATANNPTTSRTPPTTCGPALTCSSSSKAPRCPATSRSCRCIRMFLPAWRT